MVDSSPLMVAPSSNTMRVSNPDNATTLSHANDHFPNERLPHHDECTYEDENPSASASSQQNEEFATRGVCCGVLCLSSLDCYRDSNSDQYDPEVLQRTTCLNRAMDILCIGLGFLGSAC